MPPAYTTEDLLKILAEERQACLRGQRLNLAATTTDLSPVVAPFMDTEGIQKFSAYLDFRATIHRYQLTHQVSGIVWRELTLKNRTLRYPEVDEQLIALPSDLEILKAAKDSLLHYWYEVTVGMDLFLAVNRGKEYQAIAIADVQRIAQRTEWGGLSKHENARFLEIILQLGWGEPREAHHKRSWPESGSEFIYAVNPGHRPIC